MKIPHKILKASLFVVMLVSLSTFADWIEVNGPTDFGMSVRLVDGKLFVATGADGLYTSGDYGVMWIRLAVGSRESGSYIEAFTVRDNILFVAASDSVYRSADCGVTWTRCSAPLNFIRSMTSTGSELVAGTQHGVFTSPLDGSEWTRKSSGITDTNIATVAAVGGTLFAGAGRGSFYRSENGGSAWTEVTLGTRKATVHFVEAGDNYLFAGTDSSLFRSEDDGKTWSTASSGLTPQVSVNAFLALGNFYLAGTDSGVFRSADSGASWTPAHLDTSFNRINSFEVAGTALYATNMDDGVLVSHDSGTTWAICNSGIAHQWVPAMIAFGTSIFTGMTLGVYHSTDNGGSWKKEDRGINTYVNNFCLLDSMVYAFTDSGTLYQYNQSGSMWTEKVRSPWRCRTVALIANESRIFAATDSSGLYGYTPGASGWTPITTTLPQETEYTALAVNRTSIFAGTYSSGVYRSNDDGATWKKVSPAVEYLTTLSLAVHDNFVLIGTYDGVHLSTDNGDTWTYHKNGIEQKSVYHTVFKDNNIFIATQDGLYLSTDSAATWNRADDSVFGYSSPIYSLALTSTSLFAGTSSELYRRDLSEMLPQNSAAILPQPPKKPGITLGHFSHNRSEMALSFTLPKAGMVNLTVFNFSGRVVASVVNEHREAGNHTVRISTRQLGSGMYTVRAVIGGSSVAKGFSVY